MKKTQCLVWILVFAMALGLLSGCGNKTEESTEVKPVETQAPVQEPSAPAPTEAAEAAPAAPAVQKNEMLPNTFKITGYSIYVDVPGSPFNDVEYGYSQLYTNGDEYSVTVTGMDEVYDDLTLDNAFEKCFQSYANSLMSHARVGSYELSRQERVTVNGIDAIRMEGLLQSEDYDGLKQFFAGYAFIMDGIPCCIAGTVFNPDQPADYISAVNELVDAMMRTVRDTK